MSTESFVIGGVTLIFIGIFLILIGSILNETTGKSETKVGVGGFFGPFVFGFGNDPKLVKFAVTVGLIALIIFVIFFIVG